jgi:hypothetical protein
MKAIRFEPKRVVIATKLRYIAIYDQHLSAEYVDNNVIEKFTFSELSDEDIHILKFGSFNEVHKLLTVATITGKF